ncbi:MAG TPA: DUF4395 family protein [Planococcus sp. (in: firmicutes)]|nr:DUF4395 family protein [Planococcus sp. (in: firmicutes)]
MTIPKPLVQTNQVFIATAVILALVFHKAILLLPFVIGLYTLLSGKNPVILTGRKFLKKPANQYVQEDKAQQMFNQWIATVSIGFALLFFFFGFTTLGFVFSLMVAAASIVALMGYCIGCTIRYRFMMWNHHRTKTEG